MFYLSPEGKRIYTLEKVDPIGNPTFSAHPARFSPEDKYSKPTCDLTSGMFMCASSVFDLDLDLTSHSPA